MSMEKQRKRKYLSYRELKEYGYEKPYSFLMQAYLRVHHAMWLRKN